MREELQKAIDEEPEGVDAIVLAFCLATTACWARRPQGSADRLPLA
jgi:hypothetical protein